MARKPALSEAALLPPGAERLAQAYGHGARYLARLAGLAERIRQDARVGAHAAYVDGVRKAHGRKAGFRGLVKQP